MVKGLAQDCDNPCYTGIFVVLIFQVKRNGKQFEDGYQEEEVFTLYGFPHEISVSVYFILVTDVECSISYLSALL